MSPKDFNDANIPVSMFVSLVGQDDKQYKKGYRYRFACDNYCPRKGSVYEGGTEVYLRDKNELNKFINKYIMRHYKRALQRLKKMADAECDSLYYWEKWTPECGEGLK